MENSGHKPPFEIIDEAVCGDPFVKLILCEGKRYLLYEDALIEEFYRSNEKLLENLFKSQR